jgi:hypothetical protein
MRGYMKLRKGQLVEYKSRVYKLLGCSGGLATITNASSKMHSKHHGRMLVDKSQLRSHIKPRLFKESQV